MTLVFVQRSYGSVAAVGFVNLCVGELLWPCGPDHVVITVAPSLS